MSTTDADRRQWRNISISADPHTAGYVYVVQELVGTWNDDGNFEVADDPAPTRVVYRFMNESGTLLSARPAYSQA